MQILLPQLFMMAFRELDASNTMKILTFFAVKAEAVASFLRLWLVVIAAILLCSCATQSQKMTAKIESANVAETAAKKARAVQAGKEADLNRAAVFAITLNKPALATKILDAQLTLTGPQVTAEAILEKQVSMLEQDNQTLLANIDQIHSDVLAANDKADKAGEQRDALAVKLAGKADTLASYDSWFGLSGLFHYLSHAFIVLIAIAVAAVILLLALHFFAGASPLAALILTGVEKVISIPVKAVAAIIPGAIHAAGWIRKEAAVFTLPLIK